MYKLFSITNFDRNFHIYKFVSFIQLEFLAFKIDIHDIQSLTSDLFDI